MRDDEEPPPPPPAAAPPSPLPPAPARSRLRRTLHTLRSGSPFHFAAAIKRTGSTKSSASDGEITRDDRTMRKKNKKIRADAVSDASGSTRSNDGSPNVEKNKKEGGGFVRRLGSLTRRRGEGTSATPPPSEPTTDQETIIDAAPESPVSPIAVEHPVATKPFTKAAWKRKSVEPEMEKPIEAPSPENAFRRRIAFVTKSSLAMSEDVDDEDIGGDGEVGSLEEAVALARVRLASLPVAHTPSTHSHESRDTEEEGFADAMPPYGDLLDSEAAAADSATDQQQQVSATHARRPPWHSPSGDGPCARAMTFEEAADECYLTVCECCGFSTETAVFIPSHGSTPSTERREHLYKILVIGELGTGKTSIIKRYVHQFFSQHYRATIGVDFALKVLNWDANTIIRLQLWDIAGQERFGNMTRVYYKEAVGAFIVFDVSRTATFDAVVKWKTDLDSKVQLPDGSPIPCILLANKCDQQKEGLVNQPAKMDEYCREKGFAGWFETSAKENINVEEAARSLVNKILLNDKLLQSNDKDGEKFALDHRIANGDNGNVGSSKTCAC